MISRILSPPSGSRSFPGWIFRVLLLAVCVHASAADLRINEVLSGNQSGLTDENGDHPDWIELHNAGSEPIPLVGWSLSDAPKQPRKWTFTGGTIAPGAFLLVFASDKDRQPAIAPARSPDSIPGLALWLKTASIQINNASQVRRSASGDFVKFWPDSSPAGRHARQDQTALQPRFVSSPSPRVRFDGVDDLLRLSTAPATNTFSLFAVFHPNRSHEVEPASGAGVGGTSGQTYLFGAAHGGDSGAGMGLSVGTNGVSIYEHGSSYMPARTTYTGSLQNPWSVAAIVYQDRRPSLAVNGVASSEGDASVRNPVTASTEIGSGSYGAFSGDLSEIILYQRALTDSERHTVEAHLAATHEIDLAQIYHSNFRLDADGERLLLTSPGGVTTEDISIPALPRDISWGHPGQDATLHRFFSNPSPGAPNPTEGAVAFLSIPRISLPAGFHPDTVTVDLSSPDPGVEIRYTMDGSEPGPQAPLYRTPLAVTNRASLPNRLSLIPTAPGWVAPASRVFKGTVLRARAFRTNSLPSEIVTATYFIHPTGRQRYSLPVVSLATDERHFFNPNTGIYVPGNAPGGNYAQTGDAWERPVHVELFETDGRRVIAQESGVRMHGNTSFGFPLKALRLHPLNQRGTGPFRHRIFPDLPVDSFDRLLLRPSGHDHYLTMMRDGLMQGLVRETGLDMQGYRPAILFLNGEYWGIHNLQEAFEKNYFESHHPEVDADAVDYLEGYAPGAFPYEGDANHYHALVAYLQSHSLANPEAYSWVQSQMEIPNYRDYKIAEIFYYRWDIGNHRLWRPHTPDGRLRWLLFDCDVGFGGFWSEPNPWSFNMLKAALEPSGTLHGHNNDSTVFLLKSLLRSPVFQEEFVNRTADLMNTTLSSERMLAFIDRMAEEIAPEMAEHALRWRAPATVAEWQRNVAALRTFARERPRAMRQHLQSQFELGGIAQLSLHHPSPASGHIRLNTLTSVPFTDGAWSGSYFRGHPIELAATPQPGFRFTGWQEFPGLTNNPLRLTLTGDFTLTPSFELETPLRFDAAQRRPDGSIALHIVGTPSTSLVLESSPDLHTWTRVAELSLDATGRGTWTQERSSLTQLFRLRSPP